MTGLRIVAGDPGARWCGIIARAGSSLLYQDVPEATDEPLDVAVGKGVGRWVGGKGNRRCVHLGTTYLDQISASVWRAWALAGGDSDPANLPWLAAEQTPAPQSHMAGQQRMLRPGYALATMAAQGALLGCYREHRDRWAGLVLVPPGKAGGGRLEDYPPELVTPGEQRRGVDRAAGSSSAASHAREAWDVAEQGALIIAGQVRARRGKRTEAGTLW